jgi:carbon monoxide dehydrogenase subunit G
MKLEQSFEVQAPIDRVWNALIDVEHVAPCLPGAAVTGQNDDGSYSGTITIKIGPTTANYAGKLQMQDVDESARTAVMHANGTDKRGQGGATATISSTLREQDGVTHVDVVTDYHITGRLARFGRGGMIEDVSKRMLREFAKRLQDSLTGHDAAAPGPEAAAGTEPSAPAAEDVTPAGEATAGEATAGEATAGEAGDASAAGGNGAAPQPGGAAPTAPSPGATPAGPPPPTGAGPAAAPPPPRPSHPVEPIQALSLAGGVALDRLRRNPAPLVAVLLAVFFLLRRRRS